MISKLVVGDGVATDPKIWRSLTKGRRPFLLSEPLVFKLYGRKVAEGAPLHLFATGEEAKSWASVQKAVGAMLSKGAGRDSVVVALGGGALTDAAGFAAAIYLRGIPWITVPTTLLGQLDSGIGGKTAVNLPEGKNLVGAFHQPEAVVCDPTLLRGLPERERLSGLAEALKIALTFDPPMWKRLRAEWMDLDLSWVIKKAAGWKLKIVGEDERELTGRRELLNFGHTLGHALESAAGYGALRHGEAVIWGLRAALNLSGNFPGRDEADRFLSKLAVPLPPGLSAKDLVERTKRDKKARGGKVRFVLLKGVGKPVVRPVAEKDILRAAEALLEN
jgi:3-dehydroquinate synthetase